MIRSAAVGLSGAGRWLIVAFVCASALSADGGSNRLVAPAGPVSSHPPIGSQEAWRLASEGSATTPKRPLVSGLARLYVERPASVGVAVQLVEASAAIGRIDWLRDFAAALARRVPTASTTLILAEVEYAAGRYRAGLRHGAAAHAARPGNAEIDISYAGALAASGDVLRAYALISPWATDPLVWPGLSGLAVQRIAVIATAASPGIGDRASALWIQKGWASRDAAAQSRALAFASTHAAGRQHVPTAFALAHQALQRALDSPNPAHSALAVMNAADMSAGDRSLVRRIEGVCQQLPHDSVGRADCLISALEHSANMGQIDAAMRIFRLVQQRVEAAPLLSMRLAAVAIPLLEHSGEFREAAGLAQEAAFAAASFGDRRLEARFQVGLARARRMVGDYPAASAAAKHAEALAPEGSLVRRQASREVLDAERASRGTVGRDARELLVLLERMRSGNDSELPGSSLPRTVRKAIEKVEQAIRFEAAGDQRAALDHYLEAFNIVDGQRRTADGGVLGSVALMDVWQDVTRRSLALAFALGDPPSGLAVLERSRDPFSVAGSIVDPADIALPASAALAAFAVGPDRSWVVLVRRGEWRVIPLSISTTVLRARVRLWRELAKTNAEPEIWSRITAALTRELWEPIETATILIGVRHLHVVPDDVLHLMPFATLASRRRGPDSGLRYLVTQSPSIAAVERALTIPARSGHQVAFGLGGSGAFDEARWIRASGGRVFLGPRATESEWRRQATTAAVIHFGGHARPTGVDTASASLRLRGDSRFDGLLTIEEILEVPLPGATVVLIGCDTATRLEEPGSAAYYSQAPSLGDAFLLAGARSVVGHLWPITEEDAQLLVREFHRAGGVAIGAAALEEARENLSDRFPDRPRRWAGFVWLGAPGPTP